MATLIIPRYGTDLWIRTVRGEPLVATLRAMGAVWDWRRQHWAIGRDVLDVLRGLIAEDDAANDPPRVTIEERLRDGLATTMPRDFADLAKKRGGLWHHPSRQWCLPTRRQLNDVLEDVRGLPLPPRHRRCPACGDWGPPGEFCQQCPDGMYNL